jgi:hypothetical protein
VGAGSEPTARSPDSAGGRFLNRCQRSGRRGAFPGSACTETNRATRTEWGALKARKRSGLLAQPGGVRRATEANRCTGLAGGSSADPSEPDSKTGLSKPGVLASWGEHIDPQAVIGRLGLAGSAVAKPASLKSPNELNKEHHLMKRFSMKKKLVAGAAVATLVIGAGAAYAMWSTTGTGSGSAMASSNQTSVVTATGSTADPALWPGNPTSTAVNFSVNNPNPYAVTFNTYSGASITGVSPAGCVAADFTLTAPAGNLDAPVIVPAGNAGVAGSATILNMIHTAPDACQGAVVTVGLTVAGSQN